MRQGFLGGVVSLIRAADAAGKSRQAFGRTMFFSGLKQRLQMAFHVRPEERLCAWNFFPVKSADLIKTTPFSFRISLYTRILEGQKVLSSLLQRCWKREAGMDRAETQMCWLPRWEKPSFLPLPALLPATWRQKRPRKGTAMIHIAEDVPQAHSYPVFLEI